MMAQRRASYGNEVETPNGPAIPIGQWFHKEDPEGLYFLVRHRRGAHIDLSNGVIATTSQSNTSGWAVVYRGQDVTIDGRPIAEVTG